MRRMIAKPRTGLIATGYLALLVALGLPSPAAAEGLVYRISRADLAPPSYLIGTMHSEDPRVTRGRLRARHAGEKVLGLRTPGQQHRRYCHPHIRSAFAVQGSTFNVRRSLAVL